MLMSVGAKTAIIKYRLVRVGLKLLSVCLENKTLPWEVKFKACWRYKKGECKTDLHLHCTSFLVWFKWLQGGGGNHAQVPALQHSQVLKFSEHRYKMFRAWGRIGTTQGSTTFDDFNSPVGAQVLFQEKFLEKSGKNI